MTDETVHTDATAGDGADAEHQKLWNEIVAEEAGTTTPAEGDADPAADAADAAQIAADDAALAEADDPASKSDADAGTDADTEDGKDKDTAKAASAADAEDPWAKASPELRAAHEATLKELEQTSKNYTRVSGTVSGLQRKLNRYERPPGTDKTAPAIEGTEVKAGSSLLDSDEMKKGADEFPEVFGPLKNVITTLETKLERAERILGSFSDAQMQANDAAQSKFIFDAHPDYNAVAGSDAFHAWYASAPAYIKAGVERNAEKPVDGAEVAHIVNMFKAETGYRPPVADTSVKDVVKTPATTVDPKRKAQLESADTPRTKRAAAVRDAVPDDPEQAWKYFEDKDRQAAARS